ncbi:hypothetical protein KCP73_18080 [Salmonella enterica subsp. enterica]|nr:hypothetical protein KCP73_18080 [Salmonella enterica subsp. enterica]
MHGHGGAYSPESGDSNCHPHAWKVSSWMNTFGRSASSAMPAPDIGWKEVAGFNAGTPALNQNTFIVAATAVGGITQIIDKRGAITCAISAIRHDPP